MPRHISSSYRLQLHAGFTFSDASHIASYLHELGISHVYCSPYLQATEGSPHGYDVVDHQRISTDIGGEEGHSHFCRMLQSLDMGQVLDIVPNHMATGPANKYWWDVLENGPSSRYATWFDIDWNSTEVKLQNKILIPALGDQYGQALRANQITIRFECDSFQVWYMEHRFPLAPNSLAIPLLRAATYVMAPMLNFLADTLERLPSPESHDQEGIAARHRDKSILYELLVRLIQENPEVSAAIAHTIDELNKDIDALDAILNLQNYRLAYWRTADQELGYRRFFDINTLIGVRIERSHVFHATHNRILGWLRDGTLDGVRVDHPDGLRDPEQYFRRLQNSAPDAWILAEKILQPGESSRQNWPIAGTTGYDFLNMCNDVLVAGDGLKELSDIYTDFTRESEAYDTLVHAKKLNVQHEALGSDVNRLTQLFVEISENNRDRRDYTRAEIRRAIREVAACFPIYRTYVVPQRDQIDEEDRGAIDRAVTCAKTQRTDLDPGLFDFIGEVLALRARGDLEAEFLLRFQQFTSPVMAKGLEDTAFYCFNRMVGMNEVGGAPNCDGISVDEFYAYCAKIHSQHPRTMTTLSTHDTKRSEDVRARLAVLTEIPGRWRAALHRWARMNRASRSNGFPDRNTEYFLYQTLIGAWPISFERTITYMLKAAREAKVHTSWTQQNQAFEDALKSFIEKIFDTREIISELETFVEYISLPGRINSLAQTLIKYAAPGIPDTYQGSELWDLRLVDPDNRGPVDYEIRRSMLAELQAGLNAEEIMKRIDSGMPKLWVTCQLLHLRRKQPQWFDASAEFTPLAAEGPKHMHLIGFLRGRSVAALAPRWNLRLGSGFGPTTVELPDGPWKNILTGEKLGGGKLRAKFLFERFPVALLVQSSE
jgi:(1->4)-alpha-D-glucan 1-alpha-D-glucosylmutase